MIKVHILPILISFLILGCGGGGSSSSSSSPPISEVPNGSNPTTDFSKQDVEINANTASLIIPYSVAMTESTLQLADFLITDLKVHQVSTQSSASIQCNSLGSAEFDWQDSDNNQKLSISDSITLSFTNCKSDKLNGYIAGSVNLQITDITADSINFLTEFNAEISDGSTNIPVSGHLDLAYTYVNDEELLSIRSNQQEFTYIIEGNKEILASFELNKTISKNLNYSINYTYEVISELLEGRLSCKSNVPLTGIIYANPQIIDTQCNGKNNGSVAILKYLDKSLTTSDLVYDETYDAYNDSLVTFQASENNEPEIDSVYSAELFEGTFGNPLIEITRDKPVYERILAFDLDNINLRNLMVAKSGDKAYYYSWDSNRLGSINELDLATMQTSNIITFAEEQEISNIILSEDETKFYLTLRDYCCTIPKIYTIDLLQPELTEFASFEDLIEKASNETEYNFIPHFSETINGDIVLIVYDEGIWDEESKLIKVSADSSVSYISLGLDRASGYLDSEAGLYYTLKGTELNIFDIADENFELFSTINLATNTYNLGAVSNVIDNKVFTSSGVVFDLTNGNELGYFDGAIGSHQFLNEFDLVLNIKNSSITSYSLQHFKALSSPVNRQINGLADFDIFGSWLVGSDYLLIENLKVVVNSDSKRELLKVPINKLL